MRALLDTHVWIWLLTDPGRLRRGALRRLANADDLVLSVASVWEAVIKTDLGRLRFPTSVADGVTRSRDELGARVLAVDATHALRVGGLPALHGDPFDRILVAQALVEGLTLVSADARIAAYDVPVLDPI